MEPSANRFVAIVGAPRCGTTSLSHFLKGHPDVCFSAVKEPHFFSQFDLNGLCDQELRGAVEADYLDRYFPGRVAGQSMLAEGSVSYLYHPERMVPILRIWPEARFVIAIRDPMEMLPSLHQRLLYLGDEVETDFARAWSLIPERAEGRSVPRTCIDRRVLQYDEIARLGKYIDRFMSVVGRDRCFIAQFDDLVADPASLYRKLLSFAGLPDDGRTDFAPQRSSRGYRFGRLQRLLKRPPVALRGVAAGEKYRLRVKKLDQSEGLTAKLIDCLLAGRKRLLLWNEAAAPPVRMSSEVRRTIREALKHDVDLLSRVVDRDLSHWLADAKSNDSRRLPVMAAPDLRLTAARERRAAGPVIPQAYARDQAAGL